MADRRGKSGSSDRLHFLDSRITANYDCSHEIKRHLFLGRKAMTNLDNVLKKQRHHFSKKGLYSQSCGFFSGHVLMRELDHKEGWVPKNWCFQILVLEKTLKSPLDSKKIKPISPKGNQPWISMGRTDAEVPVLRPPDVKSQLIGKDPDAGKDWRQEEKRGWQRMRWLDSITHSMNVNLSKLWKIIEDNEAWSAAIHGVTKSWTGFSNWTATNQENQS